MTDAAGTATECRPTSGLVAVDWGSSARRAYALGPEGQLTDEMEDGLGTLTIGHDRFPAEVAALRARFGSRLMLMAGMVGSNRGWMEAPYVPCPATLADVAARLLWAERDAVAIVPGLSLIDGDRADVMRGEEVQVFGVAAMERVGAQAIICHPGTHTKWVELEAETITGFRTVMTGELFALMKEHSILAGLLNADVATGPAFFAGVEQGWSALSIGAELFSVRARVLLQRLNPDDAPSVVSGMLIGNDLRSGLAGVEPGREILVVGRGSLTRLYAAAIASRGYEGREIDGAKAFIAGMRALRELIA